MTEIGPATGTLDLLVLQVVAVEPMHGYAIAQRLKQMSRDVVQVTQGTLYPACIASRIAGFSPPTGSRRTPAATRSITSSPVRAARISRPSRPAGNA